MNPRPLVWRQSLIDSLYAELFGKDDKILECIFKRDKLKGLGWRAGVDGGVPRLSVSPVFPQDADAVELVNELLEDGIVVKEPRTESYVWQCIVSHLGDVVYEDRTARFISGRVNPVPVEEGAIVFAEMVNW